MSLRLLKVVLPESSGKDALALLGNRENVNVWQEEAADGQSVLSVLMPSGQTEEIMDLLEARFSNSEGFHLVVLSVQASIPRPEPEDSPPPSPKTSASPKEKQPIPLRVSREELYSEIADDANRTTAFWAMVFLSTVVAAIGLLRDSVALIIGAMVLAPLLGPNVAAALATTLADGRLARRAVETIVFGVFLVIGVTACMGFILDPDPTISELAARTQVELSDIAIALAAGSAGVLAFTTGASSALIGVMVAVALLPPLATCGLMLGGGHFTQALNALLLFLTNIICVNLAGVVTFMLHGIRPRTWWEAEKAKRATRIAVVVWTVTLAVLVFVILLARGAFHSLG